MSPAVKESLVTLRQPHTRQREFMESPAKRKVIRAGRRGGKTVGAAIKACEAFLAGRRVLYAAPTSGQSDAFWFEITRALEQPIRHGVYRKNETERFIELVGTEQRIKAKTAWNADTLRGDFADLLLLDEWQLMNEDAWERVGAPMLLDNNGDAIFIYTPPSLYSASVSKAKDPRHASKLFRKAKTDATGRWEAFHFTSHENPHISAEGLAEITGDMSKEAYRAEIEAEDDALEDSWFVYGAFNHESQVIPRFELPAEWPRYTGHDFGGANPAALFIAQDPATALFFAYHEYFPGGGRSAYEHTLEFKKLTKGLSVVKRVGGSHQEQEVREAYTAHGWPIAEPRQSSVLAQIDRVRGLMEHNRLFVFEHLRRTREELANCLWKIGDDNRPTNVIKDEAKFHILACLRYIGSEFMPELAGGQLKPNCRRWGGT